MKVAKLTVKELARLSSALLDARGREIVSPVPVDYELREKPISIQDQIQRLLRVELAKQAMDQGFESWDEANDFEVEDEFDFEREASKYTLLEDEIPIMKPEDPGDPSDPTEGPATPNPEGAVVPETNDPPPKEGN